MVKIKGLGRGLDALLSGNDQAKAGDVLRTLEINALKAGRYQPRTRMNNEALQELAASIKAQGLMQPVLVRQPGRDGKHEIIAGERRWRAAMIAGLTEMPALVRDVPDQSAAALSLIENIQREDLNPLEEAQGFQRLIDDFGLTHDQVSQAVGRSRSAVTNMLRLTQLAKPVQELLYDGSRAVTARVPKNRASRRTRTPTRTFAGWKRISPTRSARRSESRRKRKAPGRSSSTTAASTNWTGYSRNSVDGNGDKESTRLDA